MEHVTLELRPRLQSCNAFIIFRPGTDLTEFRVILNKDSITLKNRMKFYNLRLPNIKMVADSLSSLNIHPADDSVSFRLQTEPSDSLRGSFGTELLETSDVQKEKCLASAPSSIELPITNVDLTFSCAHCWNVITKIMNFQKVLPLPSSHCDPGEWFCCKHTNDDISKLLEPKITDYFYSAYYSVLNKDNFIESLKIEGDAVLCDKCQEVIGVVQSKDSLKLWNCCIDQHASGYSVKRAEPLDDFKAIVLSCLDDMTIGNEILLESFDRGTTKSLHLRVMEKCLSILVEPIDAFVSNDLYLETKKVMSVLSDYEEGSKTRRYKLRNAKYCRIAEKVLLAGVEYLKNTGRRFPSYFAKSIRYPPAYIFL